LKLRLSRAEQLKLEHGAAIADKAAAGQTITLNNEMGMPGKAVNLEHLRMIMSVRLEEIFQLILQDLDQADALRHVRSGVFLSGGCARTPMVAQLAERVFQVPVSIGKTNSISGLKSALDQPEFATAIGLVKFGSFQQRRRSAKASLKQGLKNTFGQFFRRS
jgi:cell division protein FtsA